VPRDTQQYAAPRRHRCSGALRSSMHALLAARTAARRSPSGAPWPPPRGARRGGPGVAAAGRIPRRPRNGFPGRLRALRARSPSAARRYRDPRRFFSAGARRLPRCSADGPCPRPQRAGARRSAADCRRCRHRRLVGGRRRRCSGGCGRRRLRWACGRGQVTAVVAGLQSMAEDHL
jgi:hypothetical protein